MLSVVLSTYIKVVLQRKKHKKRTKGKKGSRDLDRVGLVLLLKRGKFLSDLVGLDPRAYVRSELYERVK